MTVRRINSNLIQFLAGEEGLTQIYGPEKVQNVKKFIRESELRNPLDQHHRYPGNLDGQPWGSMIGFEPGSCLIEIMTLKTDIARLTNLIFPANTPVTCGYAPRLYHFDSPR